MTEPPITPSTATQIPEKMTPLKRFGEGVRRLVAGILLICVIIIAIIQAFSPKISEHPQIANSKIPMSQRIYLYSKDSARYAYSHYEKSDIESEYYIIHDDDLGDVRITVGVNSKYPTEIYIEDFPSTQYSNVLDGKIAPTDPTTNHVADEFYTVESGPLKNYTLIVYRTGESRVLLQPN